MNDTVIFLILAGIALIFKWLSGQGAGDAEKPKGPPRPNEPMPRAPVQSEEERVRRFLEALGAPPGSQPPPTRSRQVTPRPVAAPSATAPAPAPAPRAKIKRSWAQPLPPLVTAPTEEAPRSEPFVSPPPPPLSVATAPRPLPPAVPVPVVVKQSPAAAGPAAARPLSLGRMLRARGSARRAIMLREILGPPRGLQAFDSAG